MDISIDDDNVNGNIQTGVEDVGNNELQSLFKYLRTNMNPGMVGLQLDLQYSNHIPNSHSCPKNGVQNFRQKKDDPNIPTGYPGLHGRVWYRTDGITEVNSFNKPVCNIINTGTGGYGSYEGNWEYLYNIYSATNNDNGLHYYSYICKIFGDDFPDILTLVAKYKMLGQEFPYKRFTYYYLNDEFLKKDKIAQVKYERKLGRRYLNGKM